MPRRSVSKRPVSPEVLERRAAQREQLLDVADAVVRRQGVIASINQIAAEADVAKPILYRHFGDKDGLYQALAERYVTALMDQLRDALSEAGGPRERIAATICAYLAFVEEHSEPYELLMRRSVREGAAASTTVADFIQRVAAEVAVELGEELRAARLDSGAAEPWAHGIVGMVQLAGDWWLRNRTMPRARLVEYLTTLLWTGFSGVASTGAGEEASPPA
jgi:AcrR family transcriptional regulator